MKRAVLLGAVLLATAANAVPFTLTFTNTSTTYGWATGLLTLQPLIDVGLDPDAGTNKYFTYTYANSHCPAGGNDDGNALLLAQRWGPAIGPYWVVPALPANGGTATLTIDVPVGSRLSFIAWVNDTGVFDDFVALHPPGDNTTLSVPLFDSFGQPLQNVDYVLSGYDANSTSPTDGSGNTCGVSPALGTECPPTGAAATGTITRVGCNSITDGELFTIADGIHPATIFEFNKTGGVDAGHVAVPCTSNNAATVGTAMMNAINGVDAGLRVTAINNSVSLVNDFPGVAGNVPITTTGRAFTGMAGGTSCYVAPGNASQGAAGAFPPPPTPPVANFTITAGNAQNRLRWSNNGPHAGVVVVRSLSAIAWTPTNGTTYVPGPAPGASTVTVVHVDDGANAVAGFTDPAANGTRYFYKVFAHANGHHYATGNVPNSAGLFSEPTPRTGSAPFWCYAFGMASLQQPVTKLNTALFTSSQSGSVTANLTTPAVPATDGDERWRPVPLQGANQARPLPVTASIGDLLVTGDQTGRAYAINPVTGATVWKGNDGGQLGDAIQGQPIADPSRDVIFFATLNTLATNNRVYALSARNGDVVWSTPANAGLDIVSGGLAINPATNRLYVGARNGLWIYNSLDGSRLAGPIGLGALDYGVNFDRTAGVISGVSAINTAGIAYGLDLDGGVKWSVDAGPTTTWIFPTGSGFIASLKSGAVARYLVSAQADGGTSIQQVFRTNLGAGIPSGATIDFVTPPKIYVGTNNGSLLQLDYYSGAVDKTIVTTSPGGVGFPTIDSTARRLHVGTFDGRVCAYPVPFP